MPRNLALRKHIWCWNKVSLLVISLHVHLLGWDYASSQTGLLFLVSMCPSCKWFRLADYIRLWVSTIIKIVFCPVYLILTLLTAYSLTLQNSLERGDTSLIFFIVRKPWQWLNQSHRWISMKWLGSFTCNYICRLSFWIMSLKISVLKPVIGLTLYYPLIINSTLMFI